MSLQSGLGLLSGLRRLKVVALEDWISILTTRMSRSGLNSTSLRCRFRFSEIDRDQNSSY